MSGVIDMVILMLCFYFLIMIVYFGNGYLYLLFNMIIPDSLKKHDNTCAPLLLSA
jgi:hypothetical protein